MANDKWTPCEKCGTAWIQHIDEGHNYVEPPVSAPEKCRCQRPDAPPLDHWSGCPVWKEFFANKTDSAQPTPEGPYKYINFGPNNELVKVEGPGLPPSSPIPDDMKANNEISVLKHRQCHPPHIFRFLAQKTLHLCLNS